MGKVKIKRKSTLIDMTAMSDVTVLLLTFFMLTSTFVKKEPVQVQSPSSVQEQPVPVANYATVLVSPDGNVSLAINGGSAESAVDYAKEQYKAENDGKDLPAKDAMELRGKWLDDSVRINIIQQAVMDYNEEHPGKPIELTKKEVQALASNGVIGVPFKDLKAYAQLDNSDKDKLFSDYYAMSREAKANYQLTPGKIHVGIPIDDNRELNIRGKRNEFQIWMQAVKKVAQRDYPVLNQGLTTGEGLIVKADKMTPYEVMHPVLDNLQTLKMTRFTLQTALKNSKK